MSYQRNIFSSARFVQVFEHSGKSQSNGIPKRPNGTRLGLGEQTEPDSQVWKCSSASKMRLVYYRLTRGGRFIWNEKLSVPVLMYVHYKTQLIIILLFCEKGKYVDKKSSLETFYPNQLYFFPVPFCMCIHVCISIYAHKGKRTASGNSPQLPGFLTVLELNK